MHEKHVKVDTHNNVLKNEINDSNKRENNVAVELIFFWRIREKQRMCRGRRNRKCCI